MKRIKWLMTNLSMSCRFVLLIVVLPATGVLGMECVRTSQLEAFRSATLVFSGKVVKIDEVGFDRPEDTRTGEVPLHRADPSDPYLVTFAVDRVWKGSANKTARVFGFGHPSQGMGFHFLVGAEYVVYAAQELKPRNLLKKAPAFP